jgi:hypothetical protein
MNLTPKQLPHPWTPSNPEGMAWYVPAWRPGYYLHRDGVVRPHIFQHGERAGYYATEAEALATIAKYEAKHKEAAQ